MDRQTALIKRLKPYWQMEAGNAFLIPALMLFLSKAQLSWISLTAIIPMMALLLIGAAYWRAKLHQIQSQGYDITPMLRWIAAAQKPVLILTIIACILALVTWIVPAITRGRADQICTTIAATLAILEYINYYHRQLQHFDHVADFKRLLSNRGFRQSQMARDLKKLKQG